MNAITEIFGRQKTEFISREISSEQPEHTNDFDDQLKDIMQSGLPPVNLIPVQDSMITASIQPPNGPSVDEYDLPDETVGQVVDGARRQSLVEESGLSSGRLIKDSINGRGSGEFREMASQSWLQDGTQLKTTMRKDLKLNIPEAVSDTQVVEITAGDFSSAINVTSDIRKGYLNSAKGIKSDDKRMQVTDIIDTKTAHPETDDQYIRPVDSSDGHLVRDIRHKDGQAVSIIAGNGALVPHSSEDVVSESYSMKIGENGFQRAVPSVLSFLPEVPRMNSMEASGETDMEKVYDNRRSSNGVGDIKTSGEKRGAVNRGKDRLEQPDTSLLFNEVKLSDEHKIIGSSFSGSEQGQIMDMPPSSHSAVNRPAASLADPAISDAALENKIINQISEKIGLSFREGFGKATIILDPPSLGHLKMEIVVRNEHVSANITAENSQVKNMIETNIEGLKEGLMQNGLRLDEVVISFGGGSAQKEPSYREGNSFIPEYDGEAGNGEPEPENRQRKYSRNYDGAVDLFI